jgi:hypothetical protein
MLAGLQILSSGFWAYQRAKFITPYFGGTRFVPSVYGMRKVKVAPRFHISPEGDDRTCRRLGRFDREGHGWMGKSSEKAHVKHCLGDDKNHDIIGTAVDGEEEKPLPLWVVIQSGTDYHFLVLEGYLDLPAD